MKKLLALLCLFSVFFINAETFKFKYSINSKQRIECNITGKYSVNDKIINFYTQSYSTIQTVKDITNDGNALISEENYYLIKGNKFQIERIVNTNYLKNSTGEMIVNGSEEFPNLRDIPMFPNKDILPGYEWDDAGVEVQNILGIKLISTVTVFYTFIGYEIIDNIKCAVFDYEFTGSREPITNNITKLVGTTKIRLYFNNVTGTKVKELYERDYIFNIKNNIVQIKDYGTRVWFPIELMNKPDIIKDINKVIEDNNIKDITVKEDEKGIKISLENIQFLPDSSVLLSTEKVRLDKMAILLKKYYGKNILLVGHTALWGIESNRMKLSIARAQVVMDYLIKIGCIDPDKSMFTGRGALEPIADNSTESGMKKNRRVEIYILEK